MSTSTDAILAFGFDLGEDAPGPDDMDFDDWIESLAGVSYDWEKHVSGSPEYEAYAAAAKAAIDACPVELVTHCSGEYPMYFLALRGTVKKAWRGEPQQVDSTLSLTGLGLLTGVQKMEAFCSEHGIEWQAPGWYIMSYRGL